MTRYLICRYNEITLKGKNRRSFEIALRENLKRALTGIPQRSVFRLSGRVVVEFDPQADLDEARRRVDRLSGIGNYSFAWGSVQNLERLQEDLWHLVKDRSFETFRISARRAPHSLHTSSQEVNRRIGAVVGERSGKKVRLKSPDLTCHLEFIEDYAFISFEKTAGAGGLPAGTAGKVVALLSGGIDSPVAAYRMMRRGCSTIFVHFHSFPHTSREAQDKVRKLVRILNRYQFRSRLYLVPFADCQRRIVAKSPASYRVIIYRRTMLRIAEAVARRQRAWALVTGESLGQVASQTLENLTVIGNAVERPVLRPLVGNDKQETIELARRIGTYSISIEPADDCCTLFLPRRPATRCTPAQIRVAEEGLNIPDLVSEALNAAEIEIFKWKPCQSDTKGFFPVV